ncbi:MAG: MATE family efflux transporter [Clostridia bacterium]|nr:MATE family efflux transporter [Clostridia bacterium]
MDNRLKASNNREVFEDYPVAKAVLTFCIPTVIGQLITLAYNLADTFYIGRVNNPYMVAAVSIIHPLYNITVAIAALCGHSGSSLIARHLGVGKDEQAKKVSSFSFYSAVVIGGIFSLIVFLNMPWFLDFLGASENTYAYAKEYCMTVCVIGCIPTILSLTLCNIMRSVGLAKQAGFGISLGGVINMALDPLFMFVILPPGKEVVGAAIATMISNIISLIYEFAIIYKNRDRMSLSFNPFIGLPTWEEIWDLISIGVPASFASLLYDINNMLLMRFASSYNDLAAAALGITMKVERFPLNIDIGIAQATGPLLGYNYSAKNYKRLNDLERFSLFLGVSIGLLSIVLYEIFAGPIISVFIKNPDTIAYGTRFIRARILATPLMFCCFYVKFYLQALGKGLENLILGIARWAVVAIPILILFNTLFGLNGIVWAQVVADSFTGTVSLLVMNRYRKRFRKEYTL